MEKYHELKDLAPRDIVARAIDRELKKSGHPCVYLDVTHMPADETREHFIAACADAHRDILKLIEQTPEL